MNDGEFELRDWNSERIEKGFLYVNLPDRSGLKTNISESTGFIILRDSLFTILKIIVSQD